MVEIKTYLNYKCTEVPNNHFSEIINYLLKETSFRMDCPVPGDVPQFASQLLWIIKDKYPFLPVYKLQEAFYKGALGELAGTTKLSIRNVNIWINEINKAWAEGTIARRNRELMAASDIRPDEVASPESAISYSLRIQWGCQKRITRKQWDYLTTRHDDMKDKITEIGVQNVDDISPSMFLSGWTEPKEIDESIIGKIFG